MATPTLHAGPTWSRDGRVSEGVSRRAGFLSEHPSKNYLSEENNKWSPSPWTHLGRAEDTVLPSEKGSRGAEGGAKHAHHVSRAAGAERQGEARSRESVSSVEIRRVVRHGVPWWTRAFSEGLSWS